MVLRFSLELLLDSMPKYQSFGVCVFFVLLIRLALFFDYVNVPIFFNIDLKYFTISIIEWMGRGIQ